MSLPPPYDLKLVVAPEVRDGLGLHHVRVWSVRSAGPLAAPVLGARDAAALLESLPREDSLTGYRSLLTALGHPGTTPAGERLRELIAGRPWQGHGGLVDAVTLASVAAGGGVGLHDPGTLPAGAAFVVRRSPGGERIVPAFSTRSRPVPAGDLTYGIEAGDGTFTPMAWLGRRDTDSAAHQLRPASHTALVVALGHPQDRPEHTESVITTVERVLETLALRTTIDHLPT
ncbi:hypothetical protein DF268_14755 [Streptomyces sp. V2]|uniref:B3/B4 tRNA-binding domain-containing protein n=1 Tax=Streptomyces niveiscabiei TaxID=164115 RepID=A0ABW9I0H9_9ACTN|nr:hypothetical protein [Streptomyces sp. V2]PWG12743.1 hypothetical protein DF268_14755 [Streptomyces sp. V2]